VGAVTAIEPDPRRSACVRIHVAGRPCYTVPRESVAAAGITIGTAIDERAHETLGRAADAEATFRAALGALELRSYARADLGRRLVRRGHPRAAVEAALARAAEHGLLDDAKFAEDFIESRSVRGRGPLRLQRDLSAMGVARQTIDAAIAAHWPEGAENPDVPLALARKRAAQLGALPRTVKRRRLLAYLARRGFTGRTITTIVSRVLEG